jgi:hypothetical protein
MHLQILVALKEAVHSTRFIAISFDEVTSCDSVSWFSIHVYVIIYWIRVPLLLHIGKVEG